MAAENNIYIFCCDRLSQSAVFFTPGQSVVPDRFSLPFVVKKLHKEIKVNIRGVATGVFTIAATSNRGRSRSARPKGEI
jgi:hypothetical protein